MSAIPRIKTHIIGLDDEMQGGIPMGSVVLISGTPGTMKSSVCYNILHYNAAQFGLKGLYLSLEQTQVSLMHHIANLGYDISETNGNVFIEDTVEERADMEQFEMGGELPFEHVVNDIVKRVEYIRPHIFVLDSLSVIFNMAEMPKPRNSIFHMFRRLRKLNTTTLLISEMSPDKKTYSEYGIEDFLCDGIVYLKMEEVSDVEVQRRIKVVKMRTTHHNPASFKLKFERGRFQVFQVIYE